MVSDMLTFVNINIYKKAIFFSLMFLFMCKEKNRDYKKGTLEKEEKKDGLRIIYGKEVSTSVKGQQLKRTVDGYFKPTKRFN